MHQVAFCMNLTQDILILEAMCKLMKVVLNICLGHPEVHFAVTNFYKIPQCY